MLELGVGVVAEVVEEVVDGLVVASPPSGAETFLVRIFLTVASGFSSVATTLTNVMPLYDLPGLNSVTPWATRVALASPAYPTALADMDGDGSALADAAGAALADGDASGLVDAGADALADGLAAGEEEAPPAAASGDGLPAAPTA